MAKYATKAAECTGSLDRRITPADRLADLPVREHVRRHIAECLRVRARDPFSGGRSRRHLRLGRKSRLSRYRC